MYALPQWGKESADQGLETRLGAFQTKPLGSEWVMPPRHILAQVMLFTYGCSQFLMKPSIVFNADIKNI